MQTGRSRVPSSPISSAATIQPLEPRRLFATVDFVVDPSATFLQIYASLKPDGIAIPIPLSAQATGLERATAGGTIRADINASGIRFVAGSNIDLRAKAGNFAPDFQGVGEADYALAGVRTAGRGNETLASINAALRDLKFDASSSRKPQDRRTKLFPLRTATLIDKQGFAEFRSTGEIVANGGGTLIRTVANANAQAKLTGGVGSRAITMPVNATFVADLGEGVLTYTLIGRIVGREGLEPTVVIPAPPSPNNFVAPPGGATFRPNATRVSVATAIFAGDEAIV